MIKQYNRFLINKILLDLEQVLLTVCQVGGAYFGQTTHCKKTGTGANSCLTGVRGGTATQDAGSESEQAENAPSLKKINYKYSCHKKI